MQQTGTATVVFGNTTGTGNLLQLQQGGVDKFVVDNAGNIATVNGGTNAVPLTGGGTQQLILMGNTCEGAAGAQVITLSFSPALAANPRVVVTPTVDTAAGYVKSVNGLSTSGATVNLGGSETATTECVDWIAIGNK